MGEWDNMIMDVEVTHSADKIRLKFLAIAGGCGPEITMDHALAMTLLQRLSAALTEGR